MIFLAFRPRDDDVINYTNVNVKVQFFIKTLDIKMLKTVKYVTTDSPAESLKRYRQKDVSTNHSR